MMCSLAQQCRPVTERVQKVEGSEHTKSQTQNATQLWPHAADDWPFAAGAGLAPGAPTEGCPANIHKKTHTHTLTISIVRYMNSQQQVKTIKKWGKGAETVLGLLSHSKRRARRSRICLAKLTRLRVCLCMCVCAQVCVCVCLCVCACVYVSEIFSQIRRGAGGLISYHESVKSRLQLADMFLLVHMLMDFHHKSFFSPWL